MFLFPLTCALFVDVTQPYFVRRIVSDIYPCFSRLFLDRSTSYLCLPRNIFWIDSHTKMSRNYDSFHHGECTCIQKIFVSSPQVESEIAGFFALLAFLLFPATFGELQHCGANFLTVEWWSLLNPYLN